MSIRLHPYTKLLFLLFFSMYIQHAKLKLLGFIFLILICFIHKFKVTMFLRVVKKTKWLILTMLIIFSLNTPGEFIVLPIPWLNPTYEGIELGLFHVFALLNMLAMVSIYLTKTSSSELISDIFVLLIPFKYFGIKIERFAARLYLTLDLAGNQMLNVKNIFNNLFVNEHQKAFGVYQSETIEIMIPEFKKIDFLAICFFLSSAWFSL